MAGKADAWMPLYVADYLRDTTHLTRDQHGGYMLLLMACWNSGGRLPNDPGQLAAIARATPAEWRRMAPILLRFFQVDGEDIVHGRVVSEHQKAARLSEIRRQNGGKGGRPKKQPESSEKATGSANPKLTETPSPSPVGKEANASTPTQDADASYVRPVPDDAFTLAWKAYPALGRSRSKSQAKTKPIWRAAANSAGGDDRLLAAVRRYVAEDTTHKGECGPPAFDRWLRDGRWEHWLPGGTDADQASGPAPAAVFDGPPDIRAWTADRLGEPYARSYVDPARWDGANRTLLAANPFALGKLKSDLAPICAKWKFTVALAVANDTPKPDLFAEGAAA